MTRHGYDEAMREIGRRAAENGLKFAHIDGNNIFDGRSRDLWREGWRQQKSMEAVRASAECG